MLAKDWRIAPQVPTEVLRRYRNMHPILAQVLHNRGVDPGNALAFLNADYQDFNPFQLTDMNKAITRVRQAIKKGELIVIYGDFDADGATSTALMMQTFVAMGANVRPYIPHRVDEGYGLNGDALRALATKGAKLVITVDCGIRSVMEVEEGKAAGLDIIITDHHSLGPEIPKAYAVINPKQDGPPVEQMLAGVGVAYIFADALTRATQRNSTKNERANGIGHFEVEALLDLVALGTVADLAPMDKPQNRMLVKRGLRIINQAKRPGIAALLEVANIAPGTLDSTGIGFGLGPRINAAGRLESAMTAYKLLITDDAREARELALKLQKLNEQRQDLTRDAQEMVREQLEHDAWLIFASNPNFQHGIVGLVAGRLTEEFYRPAVVLREGDEESNASCRSIPQFNITQALDECADLLVRHGGHAQAAGFTVLNRNVPALREQLFEMAKRTLDGEELQPTLEIDAQVDVHQLNEDLLEELRQLEPTGHDNPTPLLVSRNVFVSDWRLVGRDDRHLKLKVARAGQPPIDCIGFGLGEWSQNMPERIDVAYVLEINEWNGRRTLQMNLKDIRPSQV